MMTPASIIQKKRDGKELNQDDIKYFIQGIVSKEIEDYQTTAFLMAVYFQGMTLDETTSLTEAMLESGERYDFSHIPGAKVEKHSTGGVGDKVSIILAPLAAACGIKVPMMSGRGLGFTGGTLDKLESISGFNVNLTREEFEEAVALVGCAMIGQSEKIAPADKKLYSLRDVTGTVECIPLITASILSKKLALSPDALVLDVKVGSGAFMKTRTQARQLAKTIIKVAAKKKLPCRAILSSMNQPLGYAAGNKIEIKECIEVLRNEKQKDLCSADLKELTIQTCSYMLEAGGVVRNLKEGRKLAHSRLADGSAWQVFQAMVAQQGGDLSGILTPRNQAKQIQSVNWTAQKRGYIGKMDTETLGKIVCELGAGRKKATDSIDPEAGMIFHKKLGNRIQAGETLATVYSSKDVDLKLLEEQFHQAIEITGVRKPVPSLIFEQH